MVEPSQQISNAATVLQQLSLQNTTWQLLQGLFETLPTFLSLSIVSKDDTFQIRIKASDLDAKATIQGGKLVDCSIPLRTNGLYNCSLMAQFFMLIQPEYGQTFNVRVLATMKGFAGLHNYEGERRVLSLSNNEGFAIKFVVKDMSLDDIEHFLMNPTYELVVIHTTGTPFAGVVGHLVLSTENLAYIRVSEEIYSVPKNKWIYLWNILPMF